MSDCTRLSGLKSWRPSMPAISATTPSFVMSISSLHTSSTLVRTSHPIWRRWPMTPRPASGGPTPIRCRNRSRPMLLVSGGRSWQKSFIRINPRTMGGWMQREERRGDMQREEAATEQRQAWFIHDRFGLFIHWGIYACAARHGDKGLAEWIKSSEKITDEAYQRYFDHFYPDLYDPTTWAHLAKQAGMRYAVITTKHHDGFCLWDSQLTEYKVTRTPAGRDLIRPWVEAFRAEGLKVGFYYSL